MVMRSSYDEKSWRGYGSGAACRNYAYVGDTWALGGAGSMSVLYELQESVSRSSYRCIIIYSSNGEMHIKR